MGNSHPISRRGVLQGAAAWAAVPPPRKPVLALVGSTANGEGIYTFEMDPVTGDLSQKSVYKTDAGPYWLALDPSRTHLYAANTAAANPGGSGSVSAFAIDRSNGHLTLLNAVGSQGSGPAHLSVHPSGRYLLVANYDGGSVAVLSIGAGGALGAATDVHHDDGKAGPQRAAHAPPGSFAISGHDRPHPHMIQSDPSGRFVLSTDLGLDRLLIWRFDAGTGKLAPHDPPAALLPAGDGPRHFAFHPNGRWLYCFQEESSTLTLFDYDAGAGRLAPRQTISSLPAGFAGTSFASEVMVSADGRFVYSANRLHNSITWFAVGEGGALTFAGEAWTRGDYPSSFNIDPAGKFLYCCNEKSDAITTFRVHRETGALTFTGRYTPAGTPELVLFLD